MHLDSIAKRIPSDLKPDLRGRSQAHSNDETTAKE